MIDDEHVRYLARCREALNKERMRLWVAALRSGEYLQGANALETMEIPLKWSEASKVERSLSDKPRQCCLGVACHVAMKNGVELEYTPAASTAIGWRTGLFESEESLLPIKVREWLGMPFPSSGDLPIVFQHGVRYAANLNDSERLSFHEIAFLVEQTYELDGPAWDRENYGQY